MPNLIADKRANVPAQNKTKKTVKYCGLIVSLTLWLLLLSYMDRDRFVELVNVVINYYYYSPVTHCSRPMVADYLQINCQGNVEDSYSLRQDRTITLSDNEDHDGGGDKMVHEFYRHLSGNNDVPNKIHNPRPSSIHMA